MQLWADFQTESRSGSAVQDSMPYKPYRCPARLHLMLRPSVMKWLSFRSVFGCSARILLQGPSWHSKGLQHTCDGLGAGEGAEGVSDGVDVLGVDVEVHQEAGLQGGAGGSALCPHLAAQRSSKQVARRRDASLQGGILSAST